MAIEALTLQEIQDRARVWAASMKPGQVVFVSMIDEENVVWDLTVQRSAETFSFIVQNSKGYSIP